MMEWFEIDLFEIIEQLILQPNYSVNLIYDKNNLSQLAVSPIFDKNKNAHYRRFGCLRLIHRTALG